MRRSPFFLIAMWAGLAGSIQTVAQSVERPNFVILLADDMGYGDLSCQGHPTIATPNIDRMAAEGIRFTQFYAAAPICTPSRAGLITGRLPVRYGLNDVLFPHSNDGLPASELTIAELLVRRGYTAACVGKWHLGHGPGRLPIHHGFDRYFGVPFSNDMSETPKIVPTSLAPVLSFVRNSRRPEGDWPAVPLLEDDRVLEAAVDQETLTRRYTSKAIAFIRENKSRPFFLFVPYTAPHTPLSQGGEFKGASARGKYGDVVAELDDSVGQILNELRRSNLAEKTLVFFTSDNGPWLAQGADGGSAGILREGKGTTWEGGVRVPAIAWRPGHLPPRVERTVGSHLDLFPTLAELSGGLPEGAAFDGRSLVPQLVGASNASSDERTLAFFNGGVLDAVRKGPWKLHLNTVTFPFRRKACRPPLLFNVEQDPSERYNLAASQRAQAAELVAEAERLQRTLTNETKLLVATEPGDSAIHVTRKPSE